LAKFGEAFGKTLDLLGAEPCLIAAIKQFLTEDPRRHRSDRKHGRQTSRPAQRGNHQGYVIGDAS
jgi:hypothetical protein